MMGMQSEKSLLSKDNINEFALPKGHYLRRIDEEIDFLYVYEAVKHLYARVGRRSTDPVVLLKMQLLGKLEGITSERRLEREVRRNVGYRWFLGINSPDQVPDHSTLSRNRNERFGRAGLYRHLLDRAMNEIIERGLFPGYGIAAFNFFRNSMSSDIDQWYLPDQRTS